MTTSVVMLIVGMVCTIFAGAKYVGLCTLEKPKKNQDILVRNAFIALFFFILVTSVSFTYTLFALLDNPGTTGLRFLAAVLFALIVSYFANGYYKSLIREKKASKKDSQ